LNRFFTNKIKINNLFLCVPEHLISDIEVKILRIFTHYQSDFKILHMNDV